MLHYVDVSPLSLSLSAFITIRMTKNAVSKYRSNAEKETERERVNVQFFLSEWHVYAFTSNRKATICQRAIEKKIVSYTSSLLLLNKIDRRRTCMHACGQFSSFVLIESIFLSFFLTKKTRVRQEEEEEKK